MLKCVGVEDLITYWTALHLDGQFQLYVTDHLQVHCFHCCQSTCLRAGFEKDTSLSNIFAWLKYFRVVEIFFGDWNIFWWLKYFRGIEIFLCYLDHGRTPTDGSCRTSLECREGIGDAQWAKRGHWETQSNRFNHNSCLINSECYQSDNILFIQ